MEIPTGKLRAFHEASERDEGQSDRQESQRSVPCQCRSRKAMSRHRTRTKTILMPDLPLKEPVSYLLTNRKSMGTVAIHVMEEYDVRETMLSIKRF
jgi:hypothetical protein